MTTPIVEILCLRCLTTHSTTQLCYKCRCMMQDPHYLGDEECVYERPGGETADDSP